jgi:XRE family transcriptional regulator, aerobic/anaerobic benzoate catabolism transcriptional regulator
LTRKRKEKYTSLMGKRIKRSREAKGMTQRVLAERAAITRKYVVDLEAGRYDPTVGVLRRIAKALGVPVADLLA